MPAPDRLEFSSSRRYSDTHIFQVERHLHSHSSAEVLTSTMRLQTMGARAGWLSEHAPVAAAGLTGVSC